MTRFPSISALLVLPLLAGACADSSDTPEALSDDRAAQSAPIAGAAGAFEQQQMATGSLVEVDADERILRVDVASDAGAPQSIDFRYDAATQVLGADGQVQALTGQDGSRVSVTYRLEGDIRHAVRVQLLPAADPASMSDVPAGRSAAPPAP